MQADKSGICPVIYMSILPPLCALSVPSGGLSLSALRSLYFLSLDLHSVQMVNGVAMLYVTDAHLLFSM